ncbi:MAG: GTP-binding protein, partial [Pseudomonadota bacterium]
DRLASYGASHVRVFAGGGGTISSEEIRELESYGVERVYSPNDGLRLGLDGMIDDVVARARAVVRPTLGVGAHGELTPEHPANLARAVSALEEGACSLDALLPALAGSQRPPVVGLTGTGGAGKSSLLDELLLRFLAAFPTYRIGVLAVDPTRRRTGGALLGDRIRMNALANERLFMRSLATRRQHLATAKVLQDSIGLFTRAGFDLVLVETAGIGQSDTEIVDLVDLSMYVMTSDFGAPSQLEKIDMIDFADLIVLNKFERRGAQDALREIRKQWRRNRVSFETPDHEVPVYPAIASRFNDEGVNRLFDALCRALREQATAGSAQGAANDDGARGG